MIECPACKRSYRIGSRTNIGCVCGQRFKTDGSTIAAFDSLTPPPPCGPGTELKAIFAELGIKPKASCGCQQKSAAMDRQGVEGCRKMRDALLADLQASYDDATLMEKASAGIVAIAKGYPLSLSGLLDLAIERAEAKGKPIKAAFLSQQTRPKAKQT